MVSRQGNESCRKVLNFQEVGKKLIANIHKYTRAISLFFHETNFSLDVAT